MRLSVVAAASASVAGTSSRLAKVAALAGLLAGAAPGEVRLVVAYLSGELPQRQIGVGWATLRDAPAPAAEPGLEVGDVDAAFTRIGAVAGKGSATERKRILTALLARATGQEQQFLVRLLSGELRQGALEAVMSDAVAKAAGVPAAEVRRAVMLSGSLPAAAQAALAGGAAALAAIGLQAGQPVKPMLAAAAPAIEDALAKTGTPAAVEWKLDGIRVQAHLHAGQVRLYTRTLDDITARLPQVAAQLAGLGVADAVLDGELIALAEDGRPLPFQDTAARSATRASPGAGADVSAGQPALTPFLFDALHLDGADLIDLAYRDRAARLDAALPAALRVPRLVTADAAQAAAFFAEAVRRGHEGVVVKSLAAPYAAGRRGASWVKVKPRHTLDLVVLAAEWGHGRRQGWLSNIHLAARDGDGGGWVMLGKTFKGLTDELLTWQTRRLLELEDHRDGWAVYVRPELVVEVAFDGVQRSPRYPGGVALRFARVLRYRPDKPASEADTIEAVRAIAAR